MGGMVAAGYAAQHPDKVDGVVLLAAYPNEKMNDAAGLLSIYGTEDGVLNRKAYEKSKPLFPPSFHRNRDEWGQSFAVWQLPSSVR